MRSFRMCPDRQEVNYCPTVVEHAMPDSSFVYGVVDDHGGMALFSRESFLDLVATSLLNDFSGIKRDGDLLTVAGDLQGKFRCTSAELASLASNFQEALTAA